MIGEETEVLVKRIMLLASQRLHGVVIEYAVNLDAMELTLSGLANRWYHKQMATAIVLQALEEYTGHRNTFRLINNLEVLYESP